jgi:hypothetical protein
MAKFYRGSGLRGVLSQIDDVREGFEGCAGDLHGNPDHQGPPTQQQYSDDEQDYIFPGFEFSMVRV